jgi:enoyl-CoA hydratase/carnithine racemase
MTDFTQIRYTVAGGVATVTLHRPEKMNAFTGVMMNELLAVFDEIDADDAVRAVIVTGEGRAFCAGADLSGGAKTFDDGDWSSPTDDRTRRDGGGRVTLRIFDCKKPVIAAINGAAVGVGATMTLPMDVPGIYLSTYRVRLLAPWHRARSLLVVVLAARRRHLASC